MSAPILQGSPAYVPPLREGVVTIPAGFAAVVIPDSAITTDSMIVVMGIAQDATAQLFGVDVISAGNSFRIRANANATAPTDVRWWILRY